MPEQSLLTIGQFRAAQMLVARMISESSGYDFEFEEIGVTWVGPDDFICAVAEDGTMMRVGDVIYAAIVLLWSTVLERAESSGENVTAVLGRMGVGLALHDPTVIEGA